MVPLKFGRALVDRVEHMVVSSLNEDIASFSQSGHGRLPAVLHSPHPSSYERDQPSSATSGTSASTGSSSLVPLVPVVPLMVQVPSSSASSVGFIFS